ncbi:sodium/potassium/calcium exchanger 4-like [Styela clava]
MPWNRNRGISTLYKYSAFHFQQNETNRNLLTRIMVVIFTLVFMVAVVLVFRWTMSAPKVVDLNLTAGQIMNKIYYRRVVEFVDYEDIIYYPKSKIDELVEPKRSEQQNGRRLLTEDTFRPNVPIEEARLIRRRRDFYSQTEQHYGEYRRHRSASSDAELKTVTVVRNNQIENDAIDQAEVEVRTLATEINPESDHGQEHRPGVSNEPTSDDQSEMDIIYMNALQVCEDALDSEKNKTTNHIGNETSEDGHHNRCAGEITSGVPALWVLLYIIIILFLFIGLAIICDDFFIASLEAISQRLNLSEDVAGATFMAAGSSAPELFISIAGAGAGSDVGVGTIVGSAVFNLLIIIALTAALAGKVLCLDWRPFVRDSIFYAMSIVAFIVFSLDTQFTYWESLMLLVLYALYIVVMKFNARLMDCMGKWNCCSCFESRVGPEDSDKSLEIKETCPKTPDPPPTRSPSPKPVSKAAVGPEVVATAPVDMSPPEKMVSQKESTIPTAPPPTSLSTPTPEIRTPESRAESVESKSANDSGICICGSNNGGGASPQPSTCTSCVIHVSSQPCNMGCVTYGSPRISRPVSRCPSCTSVKESVTVINGRSQFQNNESRNIANDVRVVEEKNTYLPNLSATDCDSRQRSDSLVTLNLTLDSKSTVKKNVNGSNNVSNSECNCENEDVKIVSETFHETAGSIDVGGPVEMGKEAAGEDDGVPTIVILPCLPAVKNPPPEKPNSSRCIPGSKYVLMYVVYILSFPWVCAFTWTVPKCDTPQKRKWYLASFFLCIAWIALVSWIMIELVEKIGCLLGIDTYTMGLVVVAVGTSVPDAISSVLVAKEGFGDMAVSNALGSNVFDINLGLGLPFFITSLVTSSPVSLLSPLQMCLFESLPLPFKIVPHVKFGLILLLVLLVAVAVFMFVRFKLNRKVTILFIVMYIAFMIYAFVQEKRCYSFFC